MPEWLSPEFLTSSAAGGGMVWVAVKIHLHYMHETLKRHEKQIDRLEAHAFNRRVEDKTV